MNKESLNVYRLLGPELRKKYPRVEEEQDEELDSDDEEGLENVCVCVEEQR